ncbi:hypothetical protein VNO77_20434 [Canavalia gladiata]|uniref:Uncharacterized protein n=1 Tax=Canavalia gladiata TaxID=3824 RepID=A0AAN9QLF3_CANGL
MNLQLPYVLLASRLGIAVEVKANVNIQTYGNTINIRPTGLHTEESKLESLIGVMYCWITSNKFDLKMCQPSQGVLVLGHDLLFLSRPSEVYVNSHELRSDRLEVCPFDPGAYFELQELAG